MTDQGKGEQREDAAGPVQPRGWRLGHFDWLKEPPIAVAAFAYLIATLFALAVLVLVAFGLFAAFQIAYETAFGKFADRIEAAKVFFPILLALVGGPLLIWRVITAHVQAQATRHQAETGREAHYTSLFTKAVEQLGATRNVSETIEIDDGSGGKKRETITKTEPNLEVRLGAIYALDRVARDSQRDHWPIMQVLCAYVRNAQNCGAPTPRPRGIKPDSPSFFAWVHSIGWPRVDVAAALRVIGERPPRRRELEAGLLDLRQANLQHATLGLSHFEEAIFERAHLDGTSFYGAHLGLASFDNAHLDNVSFEGAHLEAASFDGAHLDCARFSGAHLDRASFMNAILGYASFYQAHLAGAGFDGGRLADASFYGAHLDGASFCRTHLAGASFERACLDGATFLDATLDGASFFDADLSRTVDVDPTALANALGDASVKLPDRMERPPPTWPSRELSREERDAQIRNARTMRDKET